MPPLAPDQAFQLALQHHQAGRLADAEALYRQILAAQPNHGGAVHYLGVLAHQVGRHELAVELIQKAIAASPHDSAAHSNLGAALQASNRMDQAIASYRRAIELRPDHVEAHRNLGKAFADTGHLDEAIAAFRRALEYQPNFADALHDLGLALAAKGCPEEAAAAYLRALELRPTFAAAHANLGNLFQERGQFAAAAAAYRRALELDPNLAEVHSNLGIALVGLGQLDAAVAAHTRALELKPGYAGALNNLGIALLEKGQLDASIAASRRALELQPNYPEAHNNLGNAVRDQGSFDNAIAAYRRALELNPACGEARFNYGFLLLLRGDYEQGLPLYEARSHEVGYVPRDFPQPRWQGEPLAGRRLLIHAEQGYGDAIHFVRYAALIAARGGHVMVECPPSLVPLLRTASGAHEVVGTGTPLPPFDLHLPMLSLPLAFHTTRDAIPHEIPYLFADPDRIATWRERLGHDRTHFRVGLAWAGNPQHRRTRLRDIPFEKLQTLLRVEGVEFFSIQVDRRMDEALSSDRRPLLVDHTDQIRDFADTAALIAQLDLVISVDTAIAHLAGALGRPAWTLLPFVPDWRWGLDSQTAPWYPAMRLFRQPAIGNWDSVLERVSAELDRTANVSVRATSPPD